MFTHTSYQDFHSMLRHFTPRLPAIAMAGLLLLGLSTRARADLAVTLIGASSQTATNAPGGGNGDLPFNLAVSPFASQGTAHGETSVFVNQPATMDLSTVTVSTTGAGTVTLVFSMNNIHSPTGPGVVTETISGHVVSAAGTVGFSYSTFGSNANTLFTTVPGGAPAAGPLTGTFTTAVGGGTASGNFTASNPFSLTEVLTLTFSGAGTVSLSSDSSASFSNPEPGSIALAFSGLPVVGLLWARRRRAGLT